MTVITKTNDRDERKQISDALTSVESDVSTNTSDIATNASNISTNTTNIADHETRITTLEDGVNGKPPTSLVGIPVSNAELNASFVPNLDASATQAVSTYDTWQEVLGESSAEGIITALTIRQTSSGNASNRDWQARLLIDGTAVWTSDTNLFQTSSDDSKGFIIIGVAGTADDDVNPEAVPFSASFSLQIKKTENASGSVSADAHYKYYLTG